MEKAIFDYKKILYESLLDNDYSNNLDHAFKHKHLWVKKSTGLGVTEFFLRLMAWLCLRITITETARCALLLVLT
jgi:hypothetical protein